MKQFFGKSSTVPWAISMVILMLLSSVFTGCDSVDDDDSAIRICNGDDSEYRVELHRDSDDSMVKELWLEEWHDLTGDQCEDFSDVDEGKYYISIHEEGSSDESDRSGSFYVENDETERFWIDDTGTIKED
ncbi:hypothetical protein QUF72_08155 [Desulfobacterales bacterium HSG2]|nr:hypothetical protein [Desulfobacterales bacterium HSG2]